MTEKLLDSLHDFDESKVKDNYLSSGLMVNKSF